MLAYICTQITTTKKLNKMENILKVTGFTEAEFTKIYTDAMNKLMSVGYNESDARVIVINGVRKSLGL
jgi:hypothetical protein